MIETLKYYFANPPIAASVFWLCSLVAVGSACVAAFSRSIVRAAYSLFFTLFALAGFYVLLGADFLAVCQVVVYIGGILALILFGVLMTNRSVSDLRMDRNTLYAGVIGAATALFAMLVVSILKANIAMVVETSSSDFLPTTRRLGALLLSKYLLPFEFISLTLLIALVTALYLARRKDE